LLALLLLTLLHLHCSADISMQVLLLLLPTRLLLLLLLLSLLRLLLRHCLAIAPRPLCKPALPLLLLLLLWELRGSCCADSTTAGGPVLISKCWNGCHLRCCMWHLKSGKKETAARGFDT
jgi:hypothetical protein